MSLGAPIITGLNNGKLFNYNAMPIKGIMSDNNSSFAMNRMRYVKIAPMITESNVVQQKKKWYGNKDASQVTAKNRVSQVGIGTTNTGSNSISFMSNIETNTERQALNRMRGGGRAVVPMKNTLSTKIL